MRGDFFDRQKKKISSKKKNDLQNQMGGQPASKG
jgi:hypothetical protein